MKPTRAYSLNASQKILVFDGIFDRRTTARISQAANQTPNSTKQEPRFSFHRVLDASAFRAQPGGALLDETARGLIVRYFQKTRGHTLSYPAINSISPETESDVHIDTTGCPHCLACVFFGNESWNPQWGGELTFFDRRKIAVFAVTPKPGRLVIYPAGILHRAGVPQSGCPKPRITVGVWYRCER